MGTSADSLGGKGTAGLAFLPGREDRREQAACVPLSGHCGVLLLPLWYLLVPGCPLPVGVGGGAFPVAAVGP